GIRDFHVTGVQTCALPILSGNPGAFRSPRSSAPSSGSPARGCDFEASHGGRDYSIGGGLRKRRLAGDLSLLRAPRFSNAFNGDVQVAGEVCNGIFALRPADVLLLGGSSGVRTLTAD